MSQMEHWGLGVLELEALMQPRTGRFSHPRLARLLGQCGTASTPGPPACGGLPPGTLARNPRAQ